MADEDKSQRIARELFIQGFFGGTGRSTPAWASARIVQTVRDVRVAAGEKIYEVGDPADKHFFLVTGAVELTKPGGNTWKFGDRSLIGMVDVILERPRSRTAIATAATHLLQMRSEDWFDLLEDSFEMAERSIRAVASGVHTLRLKMAPTGGYPPVDAVATPLPSKRLNLVERILALREAPLLATAGVQPLSVLAELTEEVHTKAGELLFERGDGSGTIYVVVHGAIEVTREDPVLTARFGPGSVVCGAAVLGEAGAYEARALVPSVTLCFREEDYFDVMEEHFGVIRAAQRALIAEREALNS